MVNVNMTGSVTVNVHHYLHADQTQLDALTRIEAKLDAITTREGTMGVQLDALQSQVERNGEVEASAVTLLQGLADQVRALEPTQQAIDQFASQLSAQADALAAAVASNTMAQPAPSGGGTTPAPGSVPTGGGGSVEPPSGGGTPTTPDGGGTGTGDGSGTGDGTTTGDGGAPAGDGGSPNP